MSEVYNEYLMHHGIPKMKWGVRRFQYPDGSLTPAGRIRYGVGKKKTDGDTEQTSGLKDVYRKVSDGARKKKEARKKYGVDPTSRLEQEVHELSDEELARRIKRIKQEREYIQLITPKKRQSIVTKAVKNVFGALGKGITGSITDVSKYGLTTVGKKLVDEFVGKDDKKDDKKDEKTDSKKENKTETRNEDIPVVDAEYVGQQERKRRRPVSGYLPAYAESSYARYSDEDENSLMHTVTSKSLKSHKYVQKILNKNGKWNYIYPEDLKRITGRKKNSSGSGTGGSKASGRQGEPTFNQAAWDSYASSAKTSSGPRGRKKNVTGSGTGGKKTQTAVSAAFEYKNNNTGAKTRKQFYASIIGKPIGTNLKTGATIYGTEEDARRMWKSQRSANRISKRTERRSKVYENVKNRIDNFNYARNGRIMKRRTNTVNRYVRQISRWTKDQDASEKQKSRRARRTARKVKRMTKWYNESMSKVI